MPVRHSLFDHPDRERIEVELAMCRNVLEVSKRWGIPRRTLSRYRETHMTQAQIARIRGMTPSEAQVNIEELTRKGGEAAVIGLSRLITECIEQAKKCDMACLYAEAVRYRKLQLDAYREQAKIAALYPGRKTVNNNNLVLGDVAPVFDLIDAVLRPYPEARRAVSLAFSQSQQPALEHEP